MKQRIHSKLPKIHQLQTPMEYIMISKNLKLRILLKMLIGVSHSAMMSSIKPFRKIDKYIDRLAFDEYGVFHQQRSISNHVTEA